MIILCATLRGFIISLKSYISMHTFFTISNELSHLYRIELAGILALHLAIKAVHSESTNANIMGTVYCNNQMAVQRINKLNKHYPATVTEANEEEHKHLYEINEHRKTMPTIKLEWVKGHVQHPTNLAEHLNGRADVLAKENRLREKRHRGGGMPQRLLLQVATVVFGGTLYHRNLSARRNGTFTVLRQRST